MGKDRENSEISADRVLQIVGDLVEEFHPGLLDNQQVSLDSSLDRELGFDSLARVELLGRLEKDFGVSLPEQSFADAETPRDLLRALGAGRSERPGGGGQKIRAAEEGGAVSSPQDARSLVEVLVWHNENHPDRPHVRFYADEGEGEVLTYRQLYDGARSVAAGLQKNGLQSAEPVALMLPTGSDYLFTYFGILMAGGVPVPIYPPVSKARIEDHLQRQRAILGNCSAATLVTMPEASTFARLLMSQNPSLRAVVTVDELREPAASCTVPALAPDDTAFIQYTSGSTGTPKGVVLTHANLLANIRAMGQVMAVESEDVIVSWLPLYHDMGLIGTWLSSLYYAVPLVLMSPLDFLTRPERWLWAIHRYRGTMSPAPNFAYEICLNKLGDDELAGLDLSHLRCAFNGAEPVSPSTLERFCERFAPYGFRREALMPVYGMAECSVGLSFPPLERGPVIDRVSRKEFTSSGRAVPAEDDEDVLSFVACGRPLPRHEIRIVDDQGRELPERHEGGVQFRGPSASSGYYRNPEDTAKLFDGDWLDSGDLGYVSGGELYVTGRVKDVLIVGGRNVYPHELEEAAGEVEGVRKGNVAVIGAMDRASGTERLVVLAETRESDSEARRRIRRRIFSRSVELLDISPAELVLLPPRSIPKTSSGKIRRSACRELYRRGGLERESSKWRQYGRIAAVTVGSQWKRTLRSTSALIYAGYAWALFYLLGAPVWALTMALPRLSWRWALMRRAVRLLARLSLTPLSVRGLDNLPADRTCILVSNHASYLDGYALVAALPMPLSFVAKAELKEKWVVRAALERIGVEFVERFDRQKVLEDAGRLGERARQGRSLMFFPEGTFTRSPGLRQFRMGAFLSAAEAGLPVVPIVIRGTRSMLRANSWFPRRGAVHVWIGPPIEPRQGEGDEELWDRALELRRASRDYILHYCGEPDMGQEG